MASPVKTPVYTPGSLVSARGRSWVVMPSDHEGVVLLRPVDGSEDDSIGIHIITAV